jgi:hypothetical protein
MLSTQQLAELRLQLLKEKEDLLEHRKQNDDFGLERGHYHESMGELSSYDNHPADEGTDLFERIFAHVLEQCYARGYVKDDTVFVDSTHIKASATRSKRWRSRKKRPNTPGNCARRLMRIGKRMEKTRLTTTGMTTGNRRRPS